MNRTDQDTTIEQQNMPRKMHHSWWAWLALLLIPLALRLPLIGEKIQVSLIGYEGFCCMPEDLKESMAKAEEAKARRADSNLIIGMSIGLAIFLTFIIIFMLYGYAIPCIAVKWGRYLAKIIVGIIVFPLMALLILSALYFIGCNDSYHKIRYQPPQDCIYTYALRYTLNSLKGDL